jgi:hypothetical protein
VSNKNPVAKNSHVNRAATFDDRKKKSKKGYSKHKSKESHIIDGSKPEKDSILRS